MKLADTVQVTEYGGRKLVRRVVANLGKSIVVCNEQELQRAAQQPDGIGFPRESVRPIGEKQCADSTWT